MSLRHERARSGFTLVELTLVLGIITALTAVVIPMADTVQRDERTKATISLIEELEAACDRYWGDVKESPKEYTGSGSHSCHRLSLPQDLPGWSGPYWPHVLSRGDSPFDAHLFLYDSLSHAPGGGFFLAGTAGGKTSGAGNCVRITQVGPAIARAVDKALDSEIEGDWRSNGRVIFAEGALFVWLRSATSL